MQKIIQSFITHRTFQVREDGTLSSVKNISGGVPQGAVLSPLLYNVFTADIPKHPQSHLAIYADDIAIFASGVHLQYLQRRIQRHLDKVISWAQKWRIHINANKTQSILFTKRRRIQDLPHLRLSDQDNQYSPTITYLGVIFDRHLTWHAHINHCRNVFFRKLAYITPHFFTPSLPLAVKTRLYCQYLRSSLIYAAPAWFGIAWKRIKSLQVLQNRCLRRISSYDWDVITVQLHEDLNIESIFTVIHQQTSSLYHRALRSDNPLINEFGPYDPCYYRAHKMPRFYV